MRWNTLAARLGEAATATLVAEITVGLGQTALAGRLLGRAAVPPTFPDRLELAVAALDRARASLAWAAHRDLAPLWTPPLAPAPAVPPETPPLALPADAVEDLDQLLLSACAHLRAAGRGVHTNAPVGAIETGLAQGLVHLRLAQAVLRTTRAAQADAARPAYLRALDQAAHRTHARLVRSQDALARSRELLRRHRPRHA
jgi:hypothetical protein